MHDYNLKRLAGLNKRVQDMNFDEVVGLTIKPVSRTISYSSSHKLYDSGSKVLFIDSPCSGSKICNISKICFDVSSSLMLIDERLALTVGVKFLHILIIFAPQFD